MLCLKNDWRERERERERIEYRVFNEITRIDLPLLLPPSFFSNQVSPPIEFFNARILGEKRSSSRPASQLSPPFVTSSSLGMLNPISFADSTDKCWKMLRQPPSSSMIVDVELKRDGVVDATTNLDKTA